MTIVAQEDTRNDAWAKDQSMFGQRMLMKMGWSHGNGLGKNQQGTSTNLRALRREDGLGIGAKTDKFGGDGFSTTSRNFHGLLATLKAEHGDEEEGREVAKKLKKKKKKRDKKRKRMEEIDSDSSEAGITKSIDGKNPSITLATNRVSAGHSRKMLESKDLTKKSKEDMAAIFGVSASAYGSSSVWGRLSSSAESVAVPSVVSEKISSKKQLVLTDGALETLAKCSTDDEVIIEKQTKKKEKKDRKKKRKRKDRELESDKPKNKR